MTESQPLLNRANSVINTNKTNTSSAKKREKRRKPPVETQLGSEKKKGRFNSKKKKKNHSDNFHKPSKGHSPSGSKHTTSVTDLLEDDKSVQTGKSDSQKKSSKQSFLETPMAFPIQNGNDRQKESSKNKTSKQSRALMETLSKPEEKTILKQKGALQKSEKLTGPVLPKKITSQLEINNSINAVEIEKHCSSLGNNKVSFVENTSTERLVEKRKPVIPFKPRKPTNIVETKRHGSPVSTGKNSNVIEIKKISNPSDTRNHSCPPETKKLFSEINDTSITSESKKFVIQNETKTRKNSNESNTPATLIENKKLVSRTATKKHTNPDETKRLSSQSEINDISTTLESKKLFSQNETQTRENSSESNARVTSLENKKSVSQTGTTEHTNPDETKRLSSPSEVNNISTTSESKKLVNQSETITHANASETNTTLIISVESKNPVIRTETTEHANPDGTKKHDSPTNTKKLVSQTQTRKLVGSSQMKTLDSDGIDKPNGESFTITTTFLRNVHSSSVTSSCELTTDETRQNAGPTSEEMSVISAGKVDPHLPKAVQNRLVLLSSKNDEDSRQLAKIEKKSRRDSELKVTKSPEFFASKPGEIPPLKISRRLPAQVVDRDKFDYISFTYNSGTSIEV
ncbi:cell wall protein IFF6-like [Limulus polyphemus]|uniref:Cell wall protein IFF6-like n=1 Tax=Limulus polyphemus TaxID=6850 RepID=A0ABM1B373_LIMPO|nr:cell wall protein IFF6-like [Limulus polyphemus]